MRPLWLALVLLVPACGGGTTPAADLAVAADLAMSPDLSAPPDLAMKPIYTVLIRGKLKDPDLAASKKVHDMVAAGGEAKAKMLGDVAHYVFLTLPPPQDGGMATPDFLAIDLWNDLGGLMQFSMDPNVQAGFAMLFAQPPEVIVHAGAAGFTEWGTLSPLGQDMAPFLFTIRGPLAGATPEDGRMAHNMAAGGGMAAAQAEGDVAHLAFLQLADMKQFLGMDRWKTLQGAQKIYGDPSFQAAFAKVFSAPPEVRAHAHTDWYQW